MNIRSMVAEDRAAVVRIIRDTPEFEPADIAVAEEVTDAYLEDPNGSGYNILVAEDTPGIAGYVCYGPTPLTQGTWDIYWMAVAPREKGRGIGKALIGHAEAHISEAHGRLAVIETSSRPEYESTRGFHHSQGYQVVCRVPEFYAPGDDKLILCKRLDKHGKGEQE
ncbi:MAG: GNAT family N-acetyltransferase [Dehalococcoidia bacterium]|nr:GNAT family N-acetyltransferase [Dehalococcoidia bacterium]